MVPSLFPLVYPVNYYLSYIISTDLLYLPLNHVIISKRIIHQTFISFKIEASNIEQQLCYWQVPLEKIELGDGGQRLKKTFMVLYKECLTSSRRAMF